MSRKKIIAGNWKMNMTPSEAVALINTLKRKYEDRLGEHRKRNMVLLKP